ncbi:ETEC_3214 domain-containing protein [Streptomyces phaeochromogenes]|uniref:ETEC_3214 domain-containing protein n=1 Tax=Streptomyces phaeochromogenes TaxID=1923 RepID=UPI0036C6FB3A
MKDQSDPAFSSTLNVWTLATLFVATVTLATILVGWWRASVGKSRHVKRRLRRLAPNVRHEYVKELFGEPAWERPETRTRGNQERVPVHLTVRTWPLGGLAYLVTWSRQESENEGFKDTVLMYSVTTRSRLFRPRFRITGSSVRLGATRVAALGEAGSSRRAASFSLSADYFGYAEEHHYGAPIGDRLFGVCAAGYRATPSPPEIDDEGNAVSSEALTSYRHTAVVNSVMVIGTLPAAWLPKDVGADPQEVYRLDPGYQALSSVWQRLRRTSKGLQGW